MLSHYHLSLISRLRLAVLPGALCAACSGSADAAADAGASSGPTACAASQLHVQGTIDGMAVDLTESDAGGVLVNKVDTDPGEFTSQFTGGDFKIWFDAPTANGGVSHARGIFRDGVAPLWVGNCEDTFPGTFALSADGKLVTFELEQLSSLPCGLPVEGQLMGCYKFPN